MKMIPTVGSGWRPSTSGTLDSMVRDALASDSDQVSRQSFPGLLCRPLEYEGGIRVSFVVSGEAVRLEWRGEVLGQWKRSQVSVGRSSGTVFVLSLAGDQWSFVPDNPPGFAFTNLKWSAESVLEPRSGRWIGRLRTRVDSARLGIAAVGATAMALATTAGIFMGRYRIDDSMAALTFGILVAAGTGAVLAVAIGSGANRDAKGRMSGDEPPVLTSRPGAPPLSVRAVMAALADASVGTRGSEHGTELTGSEPVGENSDSTRNVSDSTIEPSVSHIEASLSDENDRPMAVLAALDPDSVAGSGIIDVQSEPDQGVSDAQREARWVRLDLRGARLASAQVDDDEEAEFSEDLTMVRGIGPALSDALGELGIVNLELLASLDSDEIDWLRDRLGRFGSRVRTDDWVGQAKKLVEERVRDVGEFLSND